MDKAVQRKLLLELRKEQEKELWKKNSEWIKKRVLTMLSSEVKTVFLYASYNGEVDTWELIEELMKSGYRIALPKVEEKEIEFYEVQDLSLLIKSKMGILEPDTRFCIKADQENSVLLVPIVGFDESCNRMGYGGGFYDRYLSGNKREHQKVIGLAFELQNKADLLVEEKDETLDCIVTEKRTIWKALEKELGAVVKS